MTKVRDLAVVLAFVRVNVGLFNGQAGELNQRHTLWQPVDERPELTPEFWRSVMADPDNQEILERVANELLAESCRAHLEKGV